MKTRDKGLEGYGFLGLSHNKRASGGGGGLV